MKPQLMQHLFDKIGDPATLTVFTENGVDSHGDTQWTETVYNFDYCIPSDTTNTRMPFDRRGELGHYYMMQMEFFVLDDVYIPQNTSVDKPSVLTHLGLEYEITEIENSKIGSLRLIGYRKRV